jgi:hypothetical protein
LSVTSVIYFESKTFYSHGTHIKKGEFVRSGKIRTDLNYKKSTHKSRKITRARALLLLDPDKSRAEIESD